MKLALDWDDTITTYRQGFQVLCQNFTEVYIITLNHEVTVKMTEHVLGCSIAGIFHYPIDDTELNNETYVWKADVCEELGINIIFDDDPDVIRECEKRGISAILVG